MKIDLHKSIPGAEHFYWEEVLWLPTWKIHAFPDVNQYTQLIQITNKLEHIRALFNQPITITSGLRPLQYNTLIGGAFNSCHTLGKALDFVVSGHHGPNGCNKVRDKILKSGLLNKLQIRMEDHHSSNWVHIDIGLVGKTGRFFKP